MNKMIAAFAPFVTQSGLTLTSLTESSPPPTSEGMLASATLWKVLDGVEKWIAPHKEKLRQGLLTAAMSNGSPNAKGHDELKLGAFTVTREHRQASKLNPTKVQEMLTEAKIPIADAFDATTTYVLNESRLMALVATGRLAKFDADKFRDKTYALDVKADPALVEEIAAVLPAGKIPKK